jgi:hypothetical protein
MVPAHSHDTTTRLVMTFPSTYVLSSTCTVTNLANANPSASCSVGGQTITVNNLLSTAFVGGSTTQIRIQISSFTLPSTAEATSGFTATLLNQDSTDSLFYTVD